MKRDCKWEPKTESVNAAEVTRLLTKYIDAMKNETAELVDILNQFAA